MCIVWNTLKHNTKQKLQQNRNENGNGERSVDAVSCSHFNQIIELSKHFKIFKQLNIIEILAFQFVRVRHCMNADRNTIDGFVLFRPNFTLHL